MRSLSLQSVVIAVLSALSLGWTCIEPQRPYELDWAGRTEDEHAAVLPLVSADGWQVEVSDAVAALSSTTNRLLFGDGIVCLTYRGTGPNPRVRLVAPEPVSVRGDFDAIAVWCYGNNYWWQVDPKTLQTKLWAEFVGKDGKELASGKSIAFRQDNNGLLTIDLKVSPDAADWVLKLF